MTKLSTKFAALAVIAGLGTAAATPAIAGDPNRVYNSVEVFYGDLDLTQAAHADILGQRIDGAVKKVCGRVHSPAINEMRDMKRCTEEARASGKRAKVTIMANAAKANGAATRAIR